MVISATEFKAKCLALIDEVQKTGEPLVITKHGKPVVKVFPEKGINPRRALRGTGKLVGDPFAPVIKESEIEVLK